MAKRFLSNIDLGKNEIQNVVIHKLATAPSSPTTGQIYYNTSDNRWYLYNGTSFKDVTGRLDNIISTTNALIVADNGDGTLNLSISDATGANSGLLSSSLFTELNAATDLDTASTYVKRDVSGNASFNNITLTGTPTLSTDAVSKGYVDGLISSGMSIQGSLDASTNPLYPAATTAGEAYVVTVAGKVGGASGEAVDVGDLLVAQNSNSGGDEATVGGDWFVIEANRDYATDVSAGYIQIATQTEVNTGTDNTKAVTPLTLKTYVDAIVGSQKFATNIGDGSSSTIQISHALNTLDVSVVLYDTSSQDFVETDITIIDVNTIALSFVLIPTVAQYRVVVQG